MRVLLQMQKLFTFFFNKNISIYAIFNDQSFNDTLTNDIVSFEQLGPADYWQSESHLTNIVKDSSLHLHSIKIMTDKHLINKNKRAKMALYNSSDYQTSFESTGLSVQKNQFKIYFQDDSCDGHIGFLIATILTIFDLQVTPILPTKFPVNWFLVQEKFKTDLHDGSHPAFLAARWQPSCAVVQW